jgi:hypothetical protein
MRWNPEKECDEFMEVGIRPLRIGEIKRVFGDCFEDAMRAHYLLASSSLIADVLTRLGTLKAVGKNEARLNVLIDELAIDYSGRVSYLVLLATYTEIKRSKGEWLPQYSEFAEKFDEMTAALAALESAVQEKLTETKKLEGGKNG